VNPQRVERDLRGDLGGEQLGHAGLEVAAAPGVESVGGVQDQQPGGGDLRGHVGEVVADRLPSIAQTVGLG
jgi:hypothetical protein